MILEGLQVSLESYKNKGKIDCEGDRWVAAMRRLKKVAVKRELPFRHEIFFLSWSMVMSLGW